MIRELRRSGSHEGATRLENIMDALAFSACPNPPDKSSNAPILSSDQAPMIEVSLAEGNLMRFRKTYMIRDFKLFGRSDLMAEGVLQDETHVHNAVLARSILKDLLSSQPNFMLDSVTSKLIDDTPQHQNACPAKRENNLLSHPAWQGLTAVSLIVSALIILCFTLRCSFFRDLVATLSMNAVYALLVFLISFRLSSNALLSGLLACFPVVSMSINSDSMDSVFYSLLAALCAILLAFHAENTEEARKRTALFVISALSIATSSFFNSQIGISLGIGMTTVYLIGRWLFPRFGWLPFCLFLSVFLLSSGYAISMPASHDWIRPNYTVLWYSVSFSLLVLMVFGWFAGTSRSPLLMCLPLVLFLLWLAGPFPKGTWSSPFSGLIALTLACLYTCFSFLHGAIQRNNTC